MHNTLPDRLTRRELLLAGAVATLGMARPRVLWAAAADASPGPHRQLLDRLCDAIIPATDTPGAGAAGVPAFVEMAIAHGLENAPDDLLPQLARALDTAAGRSFASLAGPDRMALLEPIDRAAFERGSEGYDAGISSLWRPFKALVVVGYYTSEIGGAKELRYVLTPGYFDPDVDIAPGDRAFSSDWTGVKFG
jgi:glucoside 3-dehydrogenase (cytochrome c) hitch-hiker subunit